MSQNNIVRQLWYPGAIRCQMPTQGSYKLGYPTGAVVHYTAGPTAESAIQSAIQNKYTFFVIDRDGKIYQGAPLDRWGYHAGESFHHYMGKGVSDAAVGIEMVAAGVVAKDFTSEKFKAYWHVKPEQYFPREDVRIIKQQVDNVAPGSYHKYTVEQEDALIDLCLWLKKNNPNVFRLDCVVGHDEVCVPKGRKQDPGGALSMSMPQLRSLLKKRHQN